MTAGILAYGGYIPKARLQRAEIAKAHTWFNPGLRGLGKGERSMSNWDEDSVTMAVEASRDCLAELDRNAVTGLYMASTTYPFVDRQNSGIVAEALNLGRSIQAVDLSSSQRAGTSALMLALQAASSGPVLVVAGEKRRTKAASPLEFTCGDGAAALLVGEGEVIAKYLGGATESVDFVDHFRGEGESFDYTWEERWVRDESYMKIVPGVVEAALQKSAVSADSITTFCFPAAMPRVAGMLAKKMGINDSAVADNLQANCGETGTAHSLVMLVHALEQASPGDQILAVGFGQGCDVLLFEATNAITSMKTRLGIGGHLARRREETNYNRFVGFNELLIMERGIRAEVDKNTGLTTLFRNRAMTQGFIGGKCNKCGTAQFPKSNICVAPDCAAIDSQEDEPFSDKSAKLNSYTADGLTYTPAPPNYFGMVQFDEGGRLMSDFTDVDPNVELVVGMPMRMVFRVKDYDKRRGFRRYFWKATPADVAV
jgi:hydroxymethylglutaryl-CoA synthase